MQRRWRDDDDGIDPVVALLLAREHLLPRVIDPARADKQGASRRPTDCGVDAERTGHQVGHAIGPQGDQMSLADHRVEAAADEAESNAPPKPGDRGVYNHLEG